MTRRFGDLTPLQALQAAIAIERRNTDLYRNLAQLFQSYDARLGELFASMAEEETAHRVDLEAFLQKNFPGERATGDSDAGIDEPVEAPDLDEPEVFIFDNVGVEQAIEMAERAETRAYHFYQHMAREARHPGLQELCKHMAEVEAAHQETFIRWKKSGVPPQARRAPAQGAN